METNNLITLVKDFIIETLTRLFTKTPKLFKIWQGIALLFLASAKLPAALQQLNIHVPEVWSPRVNLAITCIAGTGAVMAQLATQCKPQLDKKGSIVKETDSKKLPFTAKVEANHLLKELK